MAYSFKKRVKIAINNLQEDFESLEDDLQDYLGKEIVCFSGKSKRVDKLSDQVQEVC